MPKIYIYIYEYLGEKFQSDLKKRYYHLDMTTINDIRKTKANFTIHECMKAHMICFDPDAYVVMKVNICSCVDCITGDFMRCSDEKGIEVCAKDHEDDFETLDSDREEEFDVFGDEMFDKNEEMYEMRAESVMDVLQNNSTIALFSPANFSFELFYLCKVCDFGYATEDLVDEYNHVVNVGAPYIKVKYYKKKAKKKVLFCTNY